MSGFSEKSFYLKEFRGRTLVIAGEQVEEDLPALVGVVEELVANSARVVVLSPANSLLRALAGANVLESQQPQLSAQVWRCLQHRSCVGLRVRLEDAFAVACRDAAQVLRAWKLVWIDAAGGLRRETGERLSFVHLAELQEWLRTREEFLSTRVGLLREIRGFLEAGIPAVNLCTAQGLAEELFTYAGSGTLFTCDDYVQVRALGVDDFDAAFDLIQRGVEEGYLAARKDAEVNEVLSNAFGAFVEGRHLAGIAALLRHAQAGAGEIVSLYTLTRFLGEGIGGHLMRFAAERAREIGLSFLFACTTSERVGLFFERHGFHPAAQKEMPPEKWMNYDPTRLRQVRCYKRLL